MNDKQLPLLQKARDFMAGIFLCISSGKLNILKVLHKTQIWDKLEAIRLFQDQTFVRPRPNKIMEIIGEEITQLIL